MLTKGMDEIKKTGDRIAKVIARAGLASRRGAEKMILDGRVTVNGMVISTPALNIISSDKIVVDKIPLPSAETTRLWKYNKPIGLVTSEKDEKGRKVVFDNLPSNLPRVMSVGRLDLNSEGLLLLTNDGELKRKLELPSTGWTRKYRVRINGLPTPEILDKLKNGITVDGEKFRPMAITIDRQQGSNAWLTISIKEGKNREIRRAMNELGFKVSRLIRISYGPFRLEELKANEVEEIKLSVLKSQLGSLFNLQTDQKEPSTQIKRTIRRKKKPLPDSRNPSKRISKIK